MDIEKAIEQAKKPETQNCAECGEMYSPMDKLSILLYGKCSMHFEDGSHQEQNLLELSNHL